MRGGDRVSIVVGEPAFAAPAPDPAPGDRCQQSLIPVPVGCFRPEPAAVVFVGTMIGKDDVTQVVRFQIDRLRAGSASPWAIDGLIDVRYGDDYRFLEKGDQYLIGAGFDQVYGALASRVRPPEPDFGGNDVIGVDDSDVECPDLDDPVRTLNVDGTSVDSGVLSLLTDDRRLVLATLAVPLSRLRNTARPGGAQGLRGWPSAGCSSSAGPRSRPSTIIGRSGCARTAPSSPRRR